ncbi:tRNA (guanosine(46)-N7)-methyltransferase TrmB [Spiroplasma endosymbiont of Amphibalanus improvisus]|uniref:tRNA (guanosine(46)-N7)-methyltransferase TrmB n=1 Tax=Spiroplasma endosymbiont of Amphibalanus improvisus TaxID=3066327 RepID=UPI00313E80C6
MRLRNDPNAKSTIQENKDLVLEMENTDQIIFSELFQNTGPIHLEIGMGKGDFLIETAIQNPDINFLGIEKALPVIAIALKKINDLDFKPKNIKLIWGNMEKLFDKLPLNSIDKIYLNFSDPWPKKKHIKRRLTFDNFLINYQKILILKKGTLQIKTDNNDLYFYSLNNLKRHNWVINYYTTDIYSQNDIFLKNNIATEYEIKFRNKNKNINAILSKVPI